MQVSPKGEVDVDFAGVLDKLGLDGEAFGFKLFSESGMCPYSLGTFGDEFGSLNQCGRGCK